MINGHLWEFWEIIVAFVQDWASPAFVDGGWRNLIMILIASSSYSRN